MAASSRLEYSWSFIRELIGWARWATAGVALTGGIITRDWRFSFAVLVGAVVDIWTLREIVKGGERAVEDSGEHGTVGLGDVVHYMGIRFGAKAVLLLAAVTLPFVFDFWGMVAGVLVVDATIFIVGSIIVAARMLKAGRDVWH
ncbi:MAG: hypothetical protein IBX62_04325 [Coriobacteriia bacterium]|nr:hypothetical protein [Coriobacteriia bacterium]